jgi:hypothetical protein
MRGITSHFTIAVDLRLTQGHALVAVHNVEILHGADNVFARELTLIQYLRKAVTVPFDALFQDANNPRLAREVGPGYEDAKALFDAVRRDALTHEIAESHDVKAVLEAILAHGWMEIDAIVVWSHPRVKDKFVVVEGNRRITALRKIRETTLPREEKKLASLKKHKKVSTIDLTAQQERVTSIKRIIAETNQLRVVPIDADSVEDLQAKLPRVLAVRHISGARGWGNYAEDLWLLNRYHFLFRAKFRKQQPRWEQSLINQVAEDASLTKVLAKRRLQACALYSHFRREWGEELPKGDTFSSSDYYLFECIVKKPWLREQFGVGEDALHMPSDREEVLFKWIFRSPRGADGQGPDGKGNRNVFYRHENVLVWEQMKRYDDQNGTGFAQRFDVTDADSAPHMDGIEAEWRSHQTKRAPAQLLEELLKQFKELRAESLVDQADFLRDKLKAIKDQAAFYLTMIDASQRVPDSTKQVSKSRRR